MMHFGPLQMDDSPDILTGCRGVISLLSESKIFRKIELELPHSCEKADCNATLLVATTIPAVLTY